MILLHILTNDHQQANEIADFLVENKLILNALIHEKLHVTKKSIEGQLESEGQTLVMGKTKALLFNEIDRRLKRKYGKKMPVLYSVPIVSMDWEQADTLVKETVKV